MALTGLEIFKLLPKTNCGDCGVPTCLAFAMKLAQKKAELSECPHASDEAEEVLGAASEPPMRLIKVGVGADAFEVGGETEMFRHEKTFYHQTALMIGINDSGNKESITKTIKEADAFCIERVGEELHIDGFCLSNTSGSEEKYLETIECLMENSSKAILLDCNNPDTAMAALEKLDGRRPLLHTGNGDISRFVEKAQEHGASLVVSSDSMDDLAAHTEQIIETGFKDLFLNLKSKHAGDRLRSNTILRRSALRRGFKPFGFPQVWFVEPGDEYELLAMATVGICKYSGILVLPEFKKEMLMTLFTLRQNIYTDPQKPIQVEPKIYTIGEPRPDSPVFVTTNFSLTYFIVSGEIENGGISAWLVIPDCEGMSVLTAWAAGKFSGETIGKFAREIKLEEQVDMREIIIPGYVASISGDLEDAMPNWTVIVGPQEAVDLGPFIRNYMQR